MEVQTRAVPSRMKMERSIDLSYNRIYLGNGCEKTEMVEDDIYLLYKVKEKVKKVRL